MNPDLIAQVLALSLPVRMALLDADQTGAGWYVATFVPEVFASPEWFGRDALTQHIRNGAAWLPCNPLAIVRHAAVRRFGDVSARWGIQGACEEESVAYIVSGGGQSSRNDRGGGDFTAAIALLRGVVGG